MCLDLILPKWWLHPSISNPLVYLSSLYNFGLHNYLQGNIKSMGLSTQLCQCTATCCTAESKKALSCLWALPLSDVCPEWSILGACNVLSDRWHWRFQSQPEEWMLCLCRYELTVDDKKQSKKNPGKDRAEKSPDSIKKFYFGGSPLRTQQANFTGCISNAYFTRWVTSSQTH